MPISGALLGLLAAALFGASAPLCKLLLPSSGPLLLAGLLYLGAGISLSLFRAIKRQAGVEREAPLRRTDLVPLLCIVLFGGILGPVLMLYGLSRLAALPAALLLNLEAPLTMFVAVMFFGEHLGRREGVAALFICGGAALIALPNQSHFSSENSRTTELVGAAALFAACAFWALDNNLTQKLSVRDPVALVSWKTLGAGICNCGLALALGQIRTLPPPSTLGLALFIGALSYGLSVVLDAYALRILGAAREAAFFATAPFVGALLSMPLLHERPTLRQGIAALILAFGVALLLRARHSHSHTHDALSHEHAHVHDEHHQHEHPPELSPTQPGESHSHPHRHAPLTHEHPHVPDLHHRHRH